MTTVYEELKGESLAPYYAAFKSNATKENYTVMLRHFLNFSKLSPDELVKPCNEEAKAGGTALHPVHRATQEGSNRLSDNDGKGCAKAPFGDE
jgi:hypothetical protein